MQITHYKGSDSFPTNEGAHAWFYFIRGFAWVLMTIGQLFIFLTILFLIMDGVDSWLRVSLRIGIGIVFSILAAIVRMVAWRVTRNRFKLDNLFRVFMRATKRNMSSLSFKAAEAICEHSPENEAEYVVVIDAHQFLGERDINALDTEENEEEIDEPNNWEQSLQMINEAIGKGFSGHEIITGKAYALAHLEKYEDAQAEIEKISEEEDITPKLLIAKVKVAIGKGSKEESEKALKELKDYYLLAPARVVYMMESLKNEIKSM